MSAPHFRCTCHGCTRQRKQWVKSEEMRKWGKEREYVAKLQMSALYPDELMEKYRSNSVKRFPGVPSAPTVTWLRRVKPLPQARWVGEEDDIPVEVVDSDELVKGEPLYWNGGFAVIDTVKDLEFYVIRLSDGERMKRIPFDIEEAKRYCDSFEHNATPKVSVDNEGITFRRDFVDSLLTFARWILQFALVVVIMKVLGYW